MPLTARRDAKEREQPLTTQYQKQQSSSYNVTSEGIAAESRPLGSVLLTRFRSASQTSTRHDGANSSMRDELTDPLLRRKIYFTLKIHVQQSMNFVIFCEAI